MVPVPGYRDGTPSKAQTRSGAYAQLFLILCLLCTPLAPVSAAGLTISSAQPLSQDGTIQLSWPVEQNGQVDIRLATDPGFSPDRILYQGSDGASVLTGLANGDYYFRGRRQGADGGVSPWGPTLHVSVQHHPLGRALTFFVIGALVFVATLLLIITGARRTHGH